MKKNSAPIIIFVMILTILLGALGLSWLRQYSSIHIEKGNSDIIGNGDNDIRQWLNAIDANDEKKAILIANKLTFDYHISLPNLDYLKIFKQGNVTSTFLTSNFGHVDYIYWQDALYFSRIAKKLTAKEKTISSLCSLITKKIRYRKVHKGALPSLSLKEIWERGYGNNNDRLRVFAELALQLKYNVMIVCIVQPKTRTFLHSICEIEKDGTFAVLDFSTKYIWKKTRAMDLANRNVKLPKGWAPVIKENIANIALLAPARVQSYKSIEQLLRKRILKNSLAPDELPVFRKNPEDILDSYQHKLSRQPLLLSYWQIPIQLLQVPNIKKQYPKNWFY